MRLPYRPGVRLFEPESEREVSQEVIERPKDSCGSCGGDIGPSASFPWHWAEEDCRNLRQPISREGT